MGCRQSARRTGHRPEHPGRLIDRSRAIYDNKSTVLIVFVVMVFGFVLSRMANETQTKLIDTLPTVLVQATTLAGVVYSIIKLRTVDIKADQNTAEIGVVNAQNSTQLDKIDDLHKVVNSSLTAANAAKLEATKVSEDKTLTASTAASQAALEASKATIAALEAKLAERHEDFLRVAAENARKIEELTKAMTLPAAYPFDSSLGNTLENAAKSGQLAKSPTPVTIVQSPNDPVPVTQAPTSGSLSDPPEPTPVTIVQPPENPVPVTHKPTENFPNVT